MARSDPAGSSRPRTSRRKRTANIQLSRQELQEYVDEGHTPAMIASKCNVSTADIQAKIRKYRIKKTKARARTAREASPSRSPRGRPAGPKCQAVSPRGQMGKPRGKAVGSRTQQTRGQSTSLRGQPCKTRVQVVVRQSLQKETGGSEGEDPNLNSVLVQVIRDNSENDTDQIHSIIKSMGFDFDRAFVEDHMLKLKVKSESPNPGTSTGQDDDDDAQKPDKTGKSSKREIKLKKSVTLGCKRQKVAVAPTPAVIEADNTSKSVVGGSEDGIYSFLETTEGGTEVIKGAGKETDAVRAGSQMSSKEEGERGEEQEDVDGKNNHENEETSDEEKHDMVMKGSPEVRVSDTNKQETAEDGNVTGSGFGKEEGGIPETGGEPPMPSRSRRLNRKRPRKYADMEEDAPSTEEAVERERERWRGAATKMLGEGSLIQSGEEVSVDKQPGETGKQPGEKLDQSPTEEASSEKEKEGEEEFKIEPKRRPGKKRKPLYNELGELVVTKIGRPRLELSADNLKHCLDSGLTLARIAEVFGTCKRSITRYLELNKMRKRDRFCTIPDKELDKMVAEICAQHPDWGQVTIQQHLQSRGMSFRRCQVRNSVRRVDPIGIELRKLNNLKRRWNRGSVKTLDRILPADGINMTSTASFLYTPPGTGLNGLNQEDSVRLLREIVCTGKRQYVEYRKKSTTNGEGTSDDLVIVPPVKSGPGEGSKDGSGEGGAASEVGSGEAPGEQSTGEGRTSDHLVIMAPIKGGPGVASKDGSGEGTAVGAAPNDLVAVSSVESEPEAFLKDSPGEVAEGQLGGTLPVAEGGSDDQVIVAKVRNKPGATSRDETGDVAEGDSGVAPLDAEMGEKGQEETKPTPEENGVQGHGEKDASSTADNEKIGNPMSAADDYWKKKLYSMVMSNKRSAREPTAQMRGPAVDIPYEELQQCVLMGYSSTRIADQFKTSKNNVRRYLDAYKLGKASRFEQLSDEALDELVLGVMRQYNTLKGREVYDRIRERGLQIRKEDIRRSLCRLHPKGLHRGSIDVLQGGRPPPSRKTPEPRAIEAAYIMSHLAKEEEGEVIVMDTDELTKLMSAAEGNIVLVDEHGRQVTYQSQEGGTLSTGLEQGPGETNAAVEMIVCDDGGYIVHEGGSSDKMPNSTTNKINSRYVTAPSISGTVGGGRGIANNIPVSDQSYNSGAVAGNRPGENVDTGYTPSSEHFGYTSHNYPQQNIHHSTAEVIRIQGDPSGSQTGEEMAMQLCSGQTGFQSGSTEISDAPTPDGDPSTKGTISGQPFADAPRDRLAVRGDNSTIIHKGGDNMAEPTIQMLPHESHHSQLPHQPQHSQVGRDGNQSDLPPSLPPPQSQPPLSQTPSDLSLQLCHSQDVTAQPATRRPEAKDAKEEKQISAIILEFNVPEGQQPGPGVTHQQGNLKENIQDVVLVEGADSQGMSDATQGAEHIIMQLTDDTAAAPTTDLAGAGGTELTSLNTVQASDLSAQVLLELDRIAQDLQAQGRESNVTVINESRGGGDSVTVVSQESVQRTEQITLQ